MASLGKRTTNARSSLVLVNHFLPINFALLLDTCWICLAWKHAMCHHVLKRAESDQHGGCANSVWLMLRFLHCGLETLLELWLDFDGFFQGHSFDLLHLEEGIEGKDVGNLQVNARDTSLSVLLPRLDGQDARHLTGQPMECSVVIIPPTLHRCRCRDSQLIVLGSFVLVFGIDFALCRKVNQSADANQDFFSMLLPWSCVVANSLVDIQDSVRRHPVSAEATHGETAKSVTDTVELHCEGSGEAHQR